MMKTIPFKLAVPESEAITCCQRIHGENLQARRKFFAIVETVQIIVLNNIAYKLQTKGLVIYYEMKYI